MAFSTPVAVGDHPNRFPTSGAAHPSSLFLVCGVFLLHCDAQSSVCFCFVVMSFVVRLVSPDVLVACEAVSPSFRRRKVKGLDTVCHFPLTACMRSQGLYN